MEKLGVIGGSGLYELDGLIIKEKRAVSTPYGEPSAELVISELDGKEVIFLPRHGIGHRYSPSNLPYQANIYALKLAGVTRLLSVSAVGSMRESIKPGDIVFPDQFIDRTLNRPRTFFDRGAVAHIAFANPVCKELQAEAIAVAKELDLPHHIDGTYICIEGPQFSTKAESELFRSWGVSVIGMTNLPEARLAAEAEMSYATIALATDYDCWHEEEEAVSVEAVIATLKNNVIKAKKLLRAFIAQHDPDRPRTSPVKDCMRYAVMTDPSLISAEDRKRYAPLMAKYWEA